MILLSGTNRMRIHKMICNRMPEKPGLVFAIYRHLTGNNFPTSRDSDSMWETLMNRPEIYEVILEKIVWIMCDILSPFDYGQRIEDNPAFKFVQSNVNKETNYYFKWDKIAFHAVEVVIREFVAETCLRMVEKESEQSKNK